MLTPISLFRHPEIWRNEVWVSESFETEFQKRESLEGCCARGYLTRYLGAGMGALTTPEIVKRIQVSGRFVRATICLLHRAQGGS